MRRHWWRLVVGALVVAVGLPMTSAAPAAAAPAAPASITFVCPPGTTPEVCAAVNTIEITLRALELISPGLAPAWLLDIMDDLTVTSPLPDYEAKFEAILTEVCGGGSTAPGCLEWEGRDAAIAQRIKEAAKAANLLDLACSSGTFSWSWICPPPEAGLTFIEGVTNEFGAPSPGSQQFTGGAFQTSTVIQGPIPSGGMPMIVGSVIPAATLTTTATEIFGWDAQNNYDNTSSVKVFIYRGGTADTIGVRVYFRNHVGDSFYRDGTVAFNEADYDSSSLVFAYQRTSSTLFYLTIVGPHGYAQIYVTTGGFAGNQNVFDSTCTWGGACDVEAGDFARVGGPVITGEIAVWAHYVYPGTTTEYRTDLQTIFAYPTGDPTPEVPPRPGTEDEPTPTTELAPTSTTMPPTPSSIVPPANPTGTHEERQTGLLENLVSGVAGGFNWLGNFLGGLLRSVVDMIRWLGDIFGYWIRWLWERMGALLRQIKAAINSLGDLMEWLLQQVIDGITSLADGLWSLLQAIWNLPELIWQKFLIGLQLLFIPDDLSAVVQLRETCATSFPCGWAQEASGAAIGIGEGFAAAGAGACLTPAIGWSEFNVSFPPPTGCAAQGGTEPFTDTADSGNLLGYRLLLRGILLLLFSVRFLWWVLCLSPWVKEGNEMIANGATREEAFLG